MLIVLTLEDRATALETRNAAIPFTNANTGTTIRNILTVYDDKIVSMQPFTYFTRTLTRTHRKKVTSCGKDAGGFVVTN